MPETVLDGRSRSPPPGVEGVTKTEKPANKMAEAESGAAARASGCREYTEEEWRAWRADQAARWDK
eukprot:10789371-Alexandrium_andersonii.AAC.1